MVAVDPYVNETTRHADVILPPTPPLERDHYDLAFYQLAVRNVARWNPAVLPRPADARHDWEIFRGIGFRYARRTLSRKRLKRMLPSLARLRLTPAQVVDLGLRAGPYRLSLRQLRRTPAGIDLGPLQPSLPDDLRTRNKRIDLAPDLVLADLDRAAAVLLAPGQRDGLLLVGRRHLRSNNSWMHNSTRLVKGRPRHQLLMNPADLKERSLADGSLVRVSSDAGSVEVEVAASEDMMPGVVSLPHGFGHGRPGVRLSVASKVAGVSVNDVTDTALVDELAGTAALNGVPVTVEAV
jgi:anaerobic selenocysteine-containing dehydrogenase